MDLYSNYEVATASFTIPLNNTFAGMTYKLNYRDLTYYKTLALLQNFTLLFIFNKQLFTICSDFL